MKTFFVRLICILGLIALSSCTQLLPFPAEDADTDSPPSFSEPEVIPTEEPDFMATPTIHGVENPTGVIPEGMPAIVDGYVLLAEKAGMHVDGDYVSFKIDLSVIGDEAKLFRYNVYSIRLRDNLGNYYDYYYSSDKNCTESDIYNPKQYLINPEEDVVIKTYEKPGFSSFYGVWCKEGYDTSIPGFRAMVPAGATSLILEFEAFGPFSGFGIEFDL